MQVAINSGKGLSNGLDHKINYVARLSNNAYGINGNSWLIRTLPYLSFSTVLVDDHAQDVVMVQDQKLSTRFRWNGSGYDGLFGTRRQLTIAGGEYWVTDSRGKSWQFYGPDVVEGLRGKLQRWIDPDGVESVASYDGSQRIVSLERILPGTQHSAGLYYTFATSGVHEGRITRVEKRISRDGVAQPVRRWDYSYHTGTDSAGSANDLKTAEVFVYNMQTAAWESLGTSYYRYYKADSAIGFVHGLKYIVGPEDYARLVLAGLPPENVDAVPDEVLASYATEYREYDDQHRTTKVVLRGGALETEFNRLNSEGSDRNWKRKSVKMRADGAEIVTYFNKVNQPVLRILKKDAQAWPQYYEYNEEYKLVLQAGPDAISSFTEPANPDENLSVSLYSTKGLNKLWVYYPMSGGDAGSAPGYLKTEAVRKGTGGTVVKLREFTYTSYTEGDETIYRVASRIEYRNSSGGGTNPATTNFVYEWRLGTFQPLQITTTLPVVSLDENGSGDTYERTERLDLFGNLNWNRDEIGVLTYQTFDGLTGGIVQRIEDVNTLRMSPEVVPFGWSTPPDGGHHLINDFLTDNHGRVTQEAGPLHSVDLNGVATEVRRAAFHVYLDGRRQRWQASGYLIGDGARTLGPVRIQQRNHSGRITDTVHASHQEAGKIDGGDRFPQSSWNKWTRYLYDDRNLEVAKCEYQDIPDSNREVDQNPVLGFKNEHYLESQTGYDVLDRLNRTTSPGGTITQAVLDPRGLVLEQWVGTNDTGGSDDNPAGAGAPNNMVCVLINTYDEGQADIPGNLVEQRRPVDGNSANDGVATHDYDFRGRSILSSADDGVRSLLLAVAYDNLDQVIEVTGYHTSVVEANRISHQAAAFDALGRRYLEQAYSVDPDTGALTHALRTEHWYDPRGLEIKTVKPGFDGYTKVEFDTLRRVTATYLAYPEAGGLDGNSNDVADDIVIEQKNPSYDAAGNLLLSTSKQRLHDATGTGPLFGPGGH